MNLKKIAVLISLATIITLIAAEKKVELKIEYPEKLVKGTEVPKSIPNLEESRPKDQAPKLLMVPEGCKNLSEDKTVSSSDEDPSAGDLDMITDGDADGSEYVQIKKGLQWVQIDLEKSHMLYGAHVWHYHSQPRVYNDIIIQISESEIGMESEK